jgi:hypothetical protein
MSSVQGSPALGNPATMANRPWEYIKVTIFTQYQTLTGPDPGTTDGGAIFFFFFFF